MKQISLTILILFLSSVAFLSNANAQEDPVFMIVEQTPRFPGCEDLEGSKEEKEACASKKMLEFIYGNLKYPKEAREAGIQGQVIIQFVVEKDGKLGEIKLVRDLEGGCGAEALRAVESMNSMSEKWTPGQQRGKAVRVKYTLPVKFKLHIDKPKSDPFKAKKVYSKEDLTEQPRFPGCELKPESERKSCADMEMLKYIYSNIKYPAEARTNGIQGTVIISATVTMDGRLIDFTIEKEPGGGTGEAALKVLKDLEKMQKRFIPGKLNGQAVDSRYVIPVKFKLE